MKVLILNPPTKKLRFSRDGRCQSEENTWLDTFPPTTLASIAGVIVFIASAFALKSPEIKALKTVISRKINGD